MHRYIPNGGKATDDILKEMNHSSIDALFQDIPENLRYHQTLPIGEALSEIEVLKKMNRYAAENEPQSSFANFIGGGVYDHFSPLIINHIISRSEFYTSYTPYQAEIAQGTLQAIFEYQSLICNLTGMDASNASMYDGTNAAVEAVLLAINNDRKAKSVLVSESVNPQVLEVLRTYLRFRDIEIIVSPLKDGVIDLDMLKENLQSAPSAFLFQSPNFYGSIEPIEEIVGHCKESKVMTIDIVDPISLGILEAPGTLGVDVVVGDGQSLGNGMNFGGPYLGFMAVTKKLVRKIPGRLVGLSKDSYGNRAFVLTLQAREQHIRRYKATSNICSNQSLNALAASIYLTTMGKQGLREVCVQSHSKAVYLRNRLIDTGMFEAINNAPFFKEFALKYKGDVNDLTIKLKEEGILAGIPLDDNQLLIAVTEKRTKEEMDHYVDCVERSK